VEWTKNYRVKNGNTPFCYSVVWLAVPESGTPVNLDGAEFSYGCSTLKWIWIWIWPVFRALGQFMGAVTGSDRCAGEHGLIGVL
jgi:hypothetical protein